MSKHAFNTVISRFLKDILDTFVVTGVNDELVASAIPLAIKHNLPSADCLQLASALNLKKPWSLQRKGSFSFAQIRTYAKQQKKNEQNLLIQKRKMPRKN